MVLRSLTPSTSISNGSMVIALMAIPEPWVLTTDRTPWCVGNTIVNIFTLGVVYEGIIFPLVWMLLDKASNSNTSERIDLMEQFYVLFPTVEIRCITTDRKFVGGPWFSYLLQAPENKLKTPFRVQNNVHFGTLPFKKRDQGPLRQTIKA